MVPHAVPDITKYISVTTYLNVLAVCGYRCREGVKGQCHKSLFWPPTPSQITRDFSRYRWEYNCQKAIHMGKVRDWHFGIAFYFSVYHAD